MSLKYTLFILLFLSLSLFSNASPGNNLVSQSTNAPKGFIENKGQIIDQNNFPNNNVSYLWNGPGLNVQLRKTGFSYDIFKTVSSPKAPSEIDNNLTETKTRFDISYSVHRIDFEFENSNESILTETQDRYADPINYYTGTNSGEVFTTVSHYKKVTYKNVWNGIDVEFMIIDGKPKYNFIIHETASLTDIKLKISGANEIIQEGGDLLIKNSINDVTEKVPYSFYSNNGIKQNVKISFKKINSDTYTFSTDENIPKGSALTIDPLPDLLWSTYYGGSSDDAPYSICSDGSGNMTTTGLTNSSGNIATSGTYQTSYAGNTDIFIAKFSTAGQILWSTFYGSTGDDEAFGITSDRNNNNIIIGFTSSSSGLGTSGALYQAAFGGGASDAILAKFNSSGVKQWATYFGGTNTDYGYSVTSDTNNNIIIAGFTSSTTTIATSGAYQTSNAGAQDGFVAKFTPTGSKTWGTYYGGNQQDNFKTVCIDTFGNIYAAGLTYSSSSIASPTGPVYKRFIGSGGDGFIVKLNSLGQIQWATYFGGNGTDIIWGIVNDKSGNLIFSGNTNSSSGISTTGANQSSLGGGYDAFVGKFTPSGNLSWCTYYGGTYQDAATAVTVDNISNVYITGNTSSYSGITTANASQFYFGGGTDDGFVAKYDTGGVNLWATYCGGNLTDLGKGIAFDGTNNVVISGQTNSTSGIATSGTYQTSLSGGYDVFLTKFNACPSASAITITSNSPICSGTDLTLTSSAATNYSWTGPNSFSSTLQSPIISSATSLNAGDYTLVATLGGCLITKQITTSVLSASKPKAGFSQNYLSSCLTGNSFVFTDTSSVASGTLTRLWTFSNGDTSTSNSFTKTFTTSGTYTLKLTVVSGGNCQDSIIKTITVLPKTSIGFTIDDTIQCLSSNLFKLQDTSSYSFGTFTRVWYLGDGQITPNAPSVSKKYLTANSFIIKLVTTNSDGCMDSIQKRVTVNANPIVGYTQNNFSQCLSRNQFTLNDTSSISSGTISRLWRVSNGDTSTSSSFQKTFATSGSYNIDLIETSNLGCKDSVSKTFTSLPQNTLGFVINSTNQCFTGNHYTFVDTSTSTGYTRLWRLGDGTTTDTAIVNKSYSSVGTFTIKLITTTTSNGCTDSTQQIISVNPYVQPTVGYNQNSFAKCFSGNSFNLIDTSSISSGTMTRTWKFSDGDTSTSISPTKIFNADGVYTIKLIEVSNNGCKDSLSKTFTVYPQTKVGFTINNPAQCFNGNNFLITDTSTISSGTYTRLWDFGDASNSTSSSLNKSYLSYGNYITKIVTTSNFGCKDSTQKLINVYPNPVSGFSQNTLAECFNGNSFRFTDTSKISTGTILLSLYKDGVNIGNGPQDTTFGFTPFVTTPGVYSIKEVVHSNQGCYDSTTKTLTVYASTNTGFTINKDTQCYNGNNFLFTDTSNITSGSFSRIWTLGDGSNSLATSLNKSYLIDGNYTIKLVTTSNNNCIDSMLKTIVVKAQPQAGFTQNILSQCLTGNNFILNDTSTIKTGSMNRLWQFSNGDTSTSAILNKSFLSAGNITIKLTETSTSGCKDSAIKSIQIFPQTTVGISINKTNQCINSNNFIFNDTSIISSGSYLRLWRLGDGSTSTSQSFNKSYPSIGTYPITLITSTNNGCIDSSQINIIINSQPQAGFSQNNFAQCMGGNSFILNDTSTGVAANSSRLWKFSDGDTSTFVVASKTFNRSGLFTAKLLITSSTGCGDSVQKNFTVYPQTTIGFYQNSLKQCITNNNFILFDTSTISSGTYSRIWSLGDATTSTNSFINKSYLTEGNYQLGLYTLTNNGCIDSVKKLIQVNAQPKVGYSLNNAIQCQSGNLFTLNDTSTISSGTIKRLWKFSDGDTSTSNIVNKTFLTPGSYTSKLVIVSDNYCSDSITKSLTIYPKTAIGFSINTNTAQCLGGNNFIFQDTSYSLSGSYSRNWNFGDSTNSSLNFASKNYAAPSVYQITLTTTTANGCVDSLQKNITVFPHPKAGYDLNNFAQCLRENDFIFYDTSTLSSGSISRIWNFGDGDTSSLDSFHKTYLTDGNFQAKLIVTSDNNCKDSTTKSISVYPQPIVGFSQSGLINCFGNMITFTDTTTIASGNRIRYWDFGDTTSDTSAIVYKTFKDTGTYVVTLYSSSQHFCSDLTSKTIPVYMRPKAGFLQSSMSQCISGNGLVLNDTSTVPFGNLTRLWLFSDSTTSVQKTLNKSFNSLGLHEIKLVAISDSNCTDTATKTFNVYAKPNAGFTVNNFTQCFNSNNFIFTDTSKNIASGYKAFWDFGDASTDTSKIVNKNYGDIGYYQVSLRIVDKNNCMDSANQTVAVIVSPAKPIITLLSRTELQSTQANRYTWILNNVDYVDSGAQQLNINLNGSYRVRITNTNGCSSTSDSININNVNFNANNGNIYLYPNPASDKLYFEFNGLQGDKNIQMYNLSGQLVGEYSGSELQFVIQLDDFTKGFYMVKITSNAGVLTKKILIY